MHTFNLTLLNHKMGICEGRSWQGVACPYCVEESDPDIVQSDSDACTKSGSQNSPK